MINKKSWRIIEIVLLRYPEKKKEYESYIADILASSGSSENRIPSEEDTKPQSVTEAKALKMSSVYAERLKKEIEAVEFVYKNLKPEEQKVIRLRYWRRDLRYPVPYWKIQGCNYSERQMQRIVQKVVIQVGRYIGELQ